MWNKPSTCQAKACRRWEIAWDNNVWGWTSSDRSQAPKGLSSVCTATGGGIHQMPCFNRNQPLPQMCLCKPFLSLHELLPPESTLPGHICHMSPGTWQRKIPYKYGVWLGKNITFFKWWMFHSHAWLGQFQLFASCLLFFSCLKLIPNILLKQRNHAILGSPPPPPHRCAPLSHKVSLLCFTNLHHFHLLQNPETPGRKIFFVWSNVSSCFWLNFWETME